MLKSPPRLSFGVNELTPFCSFDGVLIGILLVLENLLSPAPFSLFAGLWNTSEGLAGIVGRRIFVVRSASGIGEDGTSTGKESDCMKKMIKMLKQVVTEFK